VRSLQNRNFIRLDNGALRLTAKITMDAGLIDELAKKYLEFSRLVRSGDTVRAIETLNSIEASIAERKISSNL